MKYPQLLNFADISLKSFISYYYVSEIPDFRNSIVQSGRIIMPEKKPNLHEGHRKRVKERFIKFGVDSFTDAHLLLDTFGGTFAKVLNADYKELVKVNGIGENAASLIKFVQMVSKKYLISSFAEDDDAFKRTVSGHSRLCEYCANLFLGLG